MPRTCFSFAGTSLKLKLALSTEKESRQRTTRLQKSFPIHLQSSFRKYPETTRKDPRVRFFQQSKGGGGGGRRRRGTNGLKATRPLKRRRRNASSMQFFLPIGAISKPAVFPVATPGKGKKGKKRKNDPRSFPQREVNALRAPQSHKETIPSANVALPPSPQPSAVSSKFQTWSLDSRHALYPPPHVRNTYTHTRCAHVPTVATRAYHRADPLVHSSFPRPKERERERDDRSIVAESTRSYFATTVPRQIIQWPLDVSVCE